LLLFLVLFRITLLIYSRERERRND